MLSLQRCGMLVNFLYLKLIEFQLCIFIVGTFFGDANPRHVLEDVYDGLYQLAHNSQLAGAFSLTVFSIGMWNKY